MSRRLVLATLSRMGPMTALQLAEECSIERRYAGNLCSELSACGLVSSTKVQRGRALIYTAESSLLPGDRKFLRELIGCYGAKRLHTTITELDR